MQDSSARVRPDASILELELLYLPLCVLMVWLSWLLHHRVKWCFRVYLGVGVGLWIMPEIDALLLRQDFPQWVSLILILKIAAGLALLFIFRKMDNVGDLMNNNKLSNRLQLVLEQIPQGQRRRRYWL
jgi:hypothetical protein